MRLALVLLFSSLVSCITTDTWTPDQRRALQQKTFDDVGFNTVFNAIKSILRDDGYVVVNQDVDGGLIVATKDLSTSMFFRMFVGDSGGVMSGKSYKVSFDLERVGEGISTRLTINEVVKYQGGREQGSELLKPEVYHSIYNALQAEVARRKAR